ncbi:nuclear transport factor 2 family protein [Nostoc sp. DedQUE09]|jgi:uncharacterized protein|uniref:nuclear transport factor 2 family protein n=1 Tax=Nostoc sp. DedQUE09 TaxID=3075394 RepID=UPI002AD55B10|nr:nuclear transport factor 2 family protein [Nostoc sp. DedQUE09]MDZ7954276.1 nuclear transport factor 2 family protein [Nostoc sp. DedQUE09]
MVQSPAETTTSRTQETLQLVKTWYAEFAKGNMQGVLDMVTDDIEWEVPGPTQVVPWCGKRQGRDKVAEYFALIDETVKVNFFQLQEIVAQDDKAMTLNHERASNRATNRVYDVPIVHFIVVRDGKIAKFNGFMETNSLVAAFLDRNV